MTNNDILRSLRYALDMSGSEMIEIFKLSEYEIDQKALADLLKKEDEIGYVSCNDDVMELFLDGLIVHKRGKKEGKPGGMQKYKSHLTNNIILKKLRIALKLRDEDIIEIIKSAGTGITKPQLTALFRKEGHKNYIECGNQFLRNFLKGLSVRYRGLS